MKIIFCFLLTFLIMANAFNYCPICSFHIGCKNNGQFSSNCPNDAHLLRISAKEIDTILLAHNTVRNKIAGGGETGFLMASKMMEVVR